MERKLWRIFLLLPILTSLVACVSETVMTVEVTRIVKETVIVYQTQDVIMTPTPKPPYTPALRACQPDNCEPYFAGAEVIRQYFTFIDQGLYEEAYGLLSQSEQDRQSFEDYIIGAESYYQVVKTITIEPYYASDPDTEIQYYVQYYHESDRPIDRNIHYSFITVIKEDGIWKLDAFANMTKRY